MRSVLATLLLLAGAMLVPIRAQVEEAARVPVLVPGITDAVDAAVGNHVFLVLEKDGTVIAWGYNNAGQLGNGRIGPLAGSGPGKTLPYVVQGTAQPIAGLTDVAGIAAGGEHVLAVKRDGSVWGWGANGDGQLGLGKRGPTGTATPVRVAGVPRATVVAAYNDASYALLDDGTVLGWGDKLWRAGGRFVSSATPLPVPGLANVVAVRAGLPCVALLRDGSVMTWGSGFLGEGSPAQREYAAVVVPQPAKVQGIDDAVAIAAGADTSAVIRRDGSVWIWGTGGYAHLGFGKAASDANADQLVPARLTGLPPAVDISLAAGSAIVLADGTVRTWGDARLGATGRPGIERIFTPTAVPSMHDVVRVWGRAYSNLALTRDGHVFAWGSVYVAR